MLDTATAANHRIMDNMQLLYKSKDAKHDFSAMRRQQMAELAQNITTYREEGEVESDSYDPVWENTMQTILENAEDTSDNILDNSIGCGIDTIMLAKATLKAGIYNTMPTSSTAIQSDIKPTGELDALHAEKAKKALAARRATDQRAAQASNGDTVWRGTACRHRHCTCTNSNNTSH
jgi:hypothetical protein